MLATVAVVWTTVVWTTSAVISVPPLIGWNAAGLYDSTTQRCQLTDDRGFVLYSAAGSFYIPLALTTNQQRDEKREREMRNMERSKREKGPVKQEPYSLSVRIDERTYADVFCEILNIKWIVRYGGHPPVSYTHLTLPTILRV